MLVSVQGGLCSVNIMSLQAVVAVVRRAKKTDWQAELSRFELLPATAFPASISVSCLAPALTRFPFPAIGTKLVEYHIHSSQLCSILPWFSVEIWYTRSYYLPAHIWV